jgi:large subunit ribosomal protein L24
MAAKSRMKKGDRVIVVTGRDKGKQGEILKVIPRERRVLVHGVNVVKRHQRQSQSQQGGIVAKEAPISISNVAHVDPENDKPTRVSMKVLGDGRKVRIAKRSGEVIDV